MNYQQTIDYLFDKLPMFSRMGSAAFKNDLTNIRILCQRLDNPQSEFRSIHVGGTNGKGSVSHMLAAVLHKAGYKTGLYTSPHLYDFRERIRVNGLMAEEQFVIDFVEKIKPAIEEIAPSFFEITVAMAFEYFSRQQVDIAIIEVGLGGRLDSTNIIVPELSVITNIGWDHMNMLGNSLQEIAAEKAGIIKENIPVVIGEKKEDTVPVFRQKALQLQSPLIFAEEQYQVIHYEWHQEQLSLEVLNLGDQSTRWYDLDLPGIYQRKNICTVLTALDVLKKNGYSLPQLELSEGLKHTKEITGLQGRWEVIHQQPTIVLEVAHNKDGMEQMLQHLQNSPHSQLHFVFGMVKDKNPDAVLDLLPKEAKYYFTQSHIPRALPANELQQIAASYALQGQFYENVNMALEQALKQASKEDLIIVCGSIFLVAEVDRKLYGRKKSTATTQNSGNIQ